MLNSSEAVYGFAAWLTCREEKTIMGAPEDVAPIVELVKLFYETNNLPAVSDNWPEELIHPS